MRKAKPKKRILLPDPKFGDVSVTRFVNNLMLDGKKTETMLRNGDWCSLTTPAIIRKG